MIRKYKDQRAASEAMAEAVQEIAHKAVAEKGRFTLALTGGSSPLILHEILLDKDIPWEKGFVFWGDERAVPFESEQNNAKMGFETLLNHVPVPKDQIYRMNSEAASVERAAEEYGAILKKHFGGEAPSFDLIILGMGADGHTASIFPGTDVINEKEKWVSTGFNKDQNTERITLTAPLINQAHHIFVAVFGEGKAETLKKVLHGPYDPCLLPSQLIKPTKGVLQWFIDEDAGKLIAATGREE